MQCSNSVSAMEENVMSSDTNRSPAKANPSTNAGNPIVTQFWEPTETKRKSLSEEDISRAFLILEANVPRTAYYGSKETPVCKEEIDELAADSRITSEESHLKTRSRSISPKGNDFQSPPHHSSSRLERNTVSSAMKMTRSTPDIYKPPATLDLLKGYQKQRELERIYIHNNILPRHFGRVRMSSAASRRSSIRSVDLISRYRPAGTRQRHSASTHRNKITTPNHTQKYETSSFIQRYWKVEPNDPYMVENSNSSTEHVVSGQPITEDSKNNTDLGNGNQLRIAAVKDSTDSDFEISMMPPPTFNRSRIRDRSPNRQTTGPPGKNNHDNNTLNNNNTTLSNGTHSAKRRKAAKDGEDKRQEGTLEIQREHTEVEIVSNEEKLESYLKECLTECSRQRLRAIHMSMRRYGNVDSRISLKDLHQVFQENYVKLSNRVFHLINETFVDHVGIDYERLHRSMARAQLGTRRDSVEAMLTNNQAECRAEGSREQIDADFLKRLEEQLILDQTFFDLEELKKSVEEKDKENTGRIPKDELYKSCAEVNIPLYGALLKNLVNHCDSGQLETVKWRQFISYLDKSQKTAIEKHPEMAELPAKAKQKQMASPLDLMDPEKKSRIVRTLLKKVSVSRVNIEAANAALADQEAEEKSRETTISTTTEGPKPDDVTISLENETPKETKTKEELIEDRSERKKRGDSDLAAPIIEVEQSSDMVAEDSETVNAQEETAISEPGPPADSVVTIRIKDKEVTLRKPAGYSLDNASVDLPSETLELDWVYGYRGNDCRSNIFVLANGEIAYFTANVVVLYDKDAHSQRHYQEHTEKIKCMAVHSNGETIATGQVDSKGESSSEAHVRVWRSDNLDTLHVLGIGIFEKAVMCLAFPKIKLDPNTEVEEAKLFNPEDQLVAIDNSEEKNITVWDISSGEMTAKETLEIEVICDVEYNTKYPDTFATIGKDHVAWWKINVEAGSIQLVNQPVYDNYMKAKFVICLTHTGQGDLITGDSNGTIYVWADGGNKITNFIKHAHEGPVFSLLLHKNVLLTGGRDSMIKSWQWGKNMEPLQVFEIAKSEGGIRMMTVHREHLLIGTTTNSILSGVMAEQGTSPLEKMKLEDLPITQGHYGDCRGLAITADGKQRGNFVSTALDGMICVFSADKHECLWKLVLKGTPFQVVDSSLAGNILVFGTKDGQLIVLTVLEDHSFQEQYRHKITKDKVTCVKISPDNNCVAAGCGDKPVSIYKKQVKDDGMILWELHGKCKGHHGSIRSIDWSTEMNEDSYFLRASSTVPEQLFWKVKTLEKVDNVEDIQHICWASNLCTLDLSTVGLWSSSQADEGDILGVDVNPAKTAVAMGDSQGYLSLFKYPSCRQGAFSHTYKAHQSVQNLRFVSDGKYLVSLGGADASIMQWKVV